jgi:uncharacterized protein
MICPACQSDQVRPAKPHGGDSLKLRLLYTPYRCRDCRHRFWVKSPVRGILVAGVAILAVTLVAIAALRDPVPVRKPVSDDRITLLRERADRQDAQAQLALGLAYMEGDGMLIDARQAVHWFEKAARAGNVEAQYHLGMALLDGHGVVQDYQAAFKWLDQAARKGYPAAQYDLGRLYYYGMGMPVDKTNAYVWFNLAAARGVEQAARNRDYALQQLKPDEVAKAQERAREMNAKLLGLPPENATDSEKKSKPGSPASP